MTARDGNPGRSCANMILSLDGPAAIPQYSPAGLYYFWIRKQTSGLLYRTPDKRYEHPLLLAPATREPPDSGKTGLAKIAFCLLPFAFCFSQGCFGAPKPDIIVAVVRLVVVADGARHVVWLIVPRATTRD